MAIPWRCSVAWAGVILAAGLLHAAPSAPPTFPGEKWPSRTAAEAGLDELKLHAARDYALTGEGAGMMVYRGNMVLSWGDTKQRFDLKSTSKSIGVTALGLAMLDGKVKLSDKASTHHPNLGVPPEDNGKTGWLADITLFHLATQTAGFEKPGGYGRLLFAPGTKWHYSDAGPNWLAECLTLAYRRDMHELMTERVFTPLGITRDDLTWRNNQYRPHDIEGIKRREFGAGVHANVDAMARLGYLYLRGGRWKDKQILPEYFVSACRTTPKTVRDLPEHEPAAEHGDASKRYGLLWWNNNDGSLPGVPKDAYWSWGLHDSLIVVIPSLDLVVARAGKSWKREKNAAHYDVLKPFLGNIVAAVKAEAPRAGLKIRWAPAETIVRLAPGSDNWPMTWGDDDLLYTAYGDGWGFEPKLPKKLSLGLARIAGAPDGKLSPENLRSPTIEQVGDDRRGGKASGLLMVDGILYMWVRNTGNARLAWSADHAKTWTWADWKLDAGFGCPTFVNYGRNYDGAADGFVYTFSPDTEDAYTPADRMVLARVLKDRIREREAYEFLEKLGDEGEPRWTRDVRHRGPVYERKGRCYRSNVTWNDPLKRYLWTMTLPGRQTRKSYRLTVLESARPWGPWSVAEEATPWDLDAGDSACVPAKWISADGRSGHLVFAGNDSFSVRRFELQGP